MLWTKPTKALAAASAAAIAVSCSPAAEPDPAPYAYEYPYTGQQKADYAMACGLALIEIEKRGVDTGDAKLSLPWDGIAVSRRGPPTVIRCPADGAKGRVYIDVEVTCLDVNNAGCHKPVRFAIGPDAVALPEAT